MNPNAFGPPSVQQQQQQQQQYPPNWQPQQQPPPAQIGLPPSAAPPTTMQAINPGIPPPTISQPQGGMLNGNYQQQLSTSMGGLTVNPLKQQQQLISSPGNVSFSNANPITSPQIQSGPPLTQTNTQLPNGPPAQQQQHFPPNLQPPQQPQQQMQPTVLSGPPSNNNNYGAAAFANGQNIKSPTPSMYPPTQIGGPQIGTPAIGQAIPGGPNQMTINSANLPGLPHMPPPKPTASPFMAPSPGPPPVNNATSPLPPGGPQQPYAPQQMLARPGPMPTNPQTQQLPPAMMSAPPSSMGGPPSMSGPTLTNSAMSGPNMSGISQLPRMPPMPGQPPNAMPGYLPQQPVGFPPQPAGYPPQQPMGYPPQQPGVFPPQQPGGYPNQMLPPQPGFNPPGPAGQYQPQPTPQVQRRLDPDQMPNPIQVMTENQRIAGGAFVTNQPGLLPPLVTTQYLVQDQGNSSPRFLRSSMYSVPATADTLKTTALPFTLIVSPYAHVNEGEYEPPIVDCGSLGPIRCNRCKAYMSPNMQFLDGGRRFQCLMCKVTTEVPTEYFAHLDHTGQRVDKYERYELVLGSYEFLATRDYCRNNTPPEIPAFIFVIDVSYNTIKSGLVHLLCSQIKQILKHLPVDQGQDKSLMRVGFITYNSTVHFYNIKSTLAQPQMLVVGDVQDMFMPLLDGFLCHPEESEAIIDALMDQIPKMFIDTKETETILYPAIQAGLEALKASNCAGKLLVFNSSLPIAEAPGKLKNRDDRKLLGTDKEKTVLTPQCQSYNNLGQECVQHGCSVDLFLFNNSYIDIATIGQVSRLTGGEVYKYTYFQAENDDKRLIEDIIKNISRPIAFDAVMRVRTSAGIRPTDFYGHFFMTNTTDVELASIDASKSIAIEIKHDDKLPPEENVYLQIALLYTSCSGQRRLRILNLALLATTTLADIFKSCDLDAIMLFFAKQACVKLYELTPKVVKENLINRSAQILACYRKHCTSPTSAGQLILPECLKLLPLYVSCLLKNDAISGGSDMTLDDRSYVMQFVLAMDLNMSVTYLYPRFIPIHNVESDENGIPMSIRCTHEKMAQDGAYILENGVYLFIWLGQSLPQSFIQPLFGVQCTQQVNAERFAITGDTPLAGRVRDIIEMIMAERSRYMRVTCVRQNDKLESVFRHYLIEDRGTDGSASYLDFLCHMHKEIKDLVS
ncbi:protein transport protein Sec24C isoform X2 [Teleopsis dalmanni]|uniref:protein transport protein Sec24C isoform X2 n=1 Tax=Teleopsis dalmanni TaxID=139649 RepID=UPI0018CDD4C1|nr:protein transport protein Sec24C isoform X2 [Teleopsis dalmanni]